MGKYEEEMRRIIRDEMSNYQLELPKEVMDKINALKQAQAQPQPKKCVGKDCNHTVKPDEKYCPECLACPSCGLPTKPEWRYCEHGDCNEELEDLE